MLLWLCFGAWANWPFSGASVKPLGNSVLLFLLFLVLGWSQFGPPIRG